MNQVHPLSRMCLGIIRGRSDKPYPRWVAVVVFVVDVTAVVAAVVVFIGVVNVAAAIVVVPAVDVDDGGIVYNVVGVLI